MAMKVEVTQRPSYWDETTEDAPIIVQDIWKSNERSSWFSCPSPLWKIPLTQWEWQGALTQNESNCTKVTAQIRLQHSALIPLTNFWLASEFLTQNRAFNRPVRHCRTVLRRLFIHYWLKALGKKIKSQFFSQYLTKSDLKSHSEN